MLNEDHHVKVVEAGNLDAVVAVVKVVTVETAIVIEVLMTILVMIEIVDLVIEVLTVSRFRCRNGSIVLKSNIIFLYYLYCLDRGPNRGRYGNFNNEERNFDRGTREGSYSGSRNGGDRYSNFSRSRGGERDRPLSGNEAPPNPPMGGGQLSEYALSAH